MSIAAFEPAPNYVPVSVRIAKRTLDIVGALVGLAVTLPLWPLIALAIRIDSPGPIVFRQLRIGRALPDRTELFLMNKFRSMRVDAETRTGAVWATKNDPRVTRVGRFLRKTRLDELPQLFNVLAGDMSLIGPRPERPGICHRLDQAIPFYAERTYGIRPGITGFAQVSQGYDETIEDVRRKLLFDHAYALALTRPLHWLGLECAIAVRTVGMMVGRRGQ
ncbi:sugar transferase [Allostella sp. ATCC 35155]|nr:sugar transferase [Stella sp. ATCC 35155]